MLMWWRVPLLSLFGIFAAIGVLGGFDVRHFPEYFSFVGILVIMFWGIPIIAVTLALIGFEKLLGKYGRCVVTLVCSAPALFLVVLFVQNGGGDGSYVLTAIASFIGWAALWFITAPRAFAQTGPLRD
jgi:hypothetical protein